MNAKLMYGYPISSIFNRVIGLIILSLIIIFIAISISPSIGLMLSILLPVLLFLFTLHFKNSFSRLREKIVSEVIRKVAMKDTEQILDIGTGSGYLAIHLAKQAKNCSIIGIDKYDLKTDGRINWFIEELKINFFGNTLHHAKQNAEIEHVEKTVDFIKADLQKPFPFDSDRFDAVVSSQFLYCIPSDQLQKVCNEIDRILKSEGRLVFFETIRFFNWNIKKVFDFFKEKGYDVELQPLEYFSNKCLFIAKKP